MVRGPAARSVEQPSQIRAGLARALTLTGGDPSFVDRWPLPQALVGGEKSTVEVQLKELLLIAAHGCWRGRRDDGCFERGARLGWLRSAAYEELVLDVLRRQGVKGEAWITQEVRTFRRSPEHIGPQPALSHDGAERVDSRSTVGTVA
jgi:hypothetical protein